MDKSIRKTARELLRDWARDRAEECKLAGDKDGYVKWTVKYIQRSMEVRMNARERS